MSLKADISSSSVPPNVYVVSVCAYFQQNIETGSGKTGVQYEIEGPIIGPW